MFKALIERFEDVQHIITGRSAADIEADVILFYDLHSSHHIHIDGIERHSAIKIEYLNDPHQRPQRGRYSDTGLPVRKLGRAQRILKDRGVEYIICPYRDGYYKYLAPHIGSDADEMLIHFPAVPSSERFASGDRPLEDRRDAVLANGATWAGRMPCYEFRKWAYNQPEVEFVEHWIRDKKTPRGHQYGAWLSQYAGALALCDWYPVPKYFEIPLAGCVPFVQFLSEYQGYGFRDYGNCVYVNKTNFASRIKDFLSRPGDYQSIASSARRFVLANYTAEHFANHVYHIAGGLM